MDNSQERFPKYKFCKYQYTFFLKDSPFREQYGFPDHMKNMLAFEHPREIYNW